MSWFGSLFSNFSFPPPADSIRAQAQSQIQSHQQSQQDHLPHQPRLLEENPPKSHSHLPPSTSPDPTLTPTEYQQLQETGRRRNKLIFTAGLAFLTLSILTTRRSLARRRLLATSPQKFYKDTPSHTAEETKSVSGALEAVEALNIATINVLSAAIMVTGGTLWYLDVNSLGDARRMIRGGLGVDGMGKTEQEADEEIEEVIASILARKDAKVKDGVAERGGR